MGQPINVLNDLLYINNQQVPFISNPIDKFSPGVNTQEYIILHFTGSTTAQSAHNQYLNPNTQVSWHLTVDRDGNVWQLLDFKKIAWHAGQSQWGQGPGALVGMNKYSIGIEHSNAGPLVERNGSFYTAFNQVIPVTDVFFDANGTPWQQFSPQQLQATRYLTLNLARILKVKDILSHEQISPGRKVDTGPAFLPTLNSIRQAYKNGTN